MVVFAWETGTAPETPGKSEHRPATAANTGMVGVSFLRSMKPTPCFQEWGGMTRAEYRCFFPSFQGKSGKTYFPGLTRCTSLVAYRTSVFVIGARSCRATCGRALS